MIKINQLSFGYNKKKLLYQNLNLELKSGKIYGLFGRNGAGKSTLIGNIIGLLKPLSGQITVNGNTSFDRKPSFLNDVSLIPEEVFLPAISLKSFLKINAVFYPKFSFEDFENNLQQLDLQDVTNLKDLSMGEQKKVLIAFSLACNTSVLIMDEPTNGLDIPSKSQFRKLITSVVSESKTILISTHQVRDLETLIDEVIILEKGEIIIQKSIEEIADNLLFKTIPHSSSEEFIFAIETLQGKTVIQENHLNEQSKVDLELLFNASIENSSKIISVLNNQTEHKI